MRTQIVSDQILIRQYLEGDEKSLERLINRHKDKIFSTIMMYVKDRYLAEDIFQDTFIKVIDTLKAGKYKEEGKFRPWVARIAYNLCIDYFRKVKRTPTITTNDGTDVFEFLPFEEESSFDKKERKDSAIKIRKLVDMLPPEQKEVVILRHYFEYSFKEIAEMTDVSINTALGRMRYALINMRKYIEKEKMNF